MSTILAAWLGGIRMGLNVAMPIGPVNIEIIRRRLGQGFAAGLLLGLGACSVDTVYIVLISSGLIIARPGPQLDAVLRGVGAVILVLLAVHILRSAGDSARRAAGAGVADRPTALWRHYTVGLAMTAVNPMNIVIWLGVIASGGGRVQTACGPWPAVIGVMCGTVAWVTGLNVALTAGRRVLRPRLLLAVNLVSAVMLLAWAGWTLWQLR